MANGPFPPSQPSPADDSSNEPGGENAKPKQAVLLKKRSAPAEGGPGFRDKPCAQCGKDFRVDADKKFYLCPDCYRKSFLKGRSQTAARILTHIVCVQCGAQEYLPFVPEDRTKALCRSCFSAAKGEQKAPSRHPRS